VVAVFGITASAVTFWVVEHLERSRAEAHFHQVAEQRLSVVRSNVAGALDTISLLASHFEATGEAGTSRQAFSILVAPVLAKHRYIQALEWIPRVERAARPEYERLARADGIHGFRFTEAQGVGFLAVAEPRDEYFPVFYVEPLAGNEKALGYNLACNPVRLAALQEARDSGRIAATARVKLVQEKGDQYGLLVFAPVYSRSQPDSVLGRRKALKGFALGVFRIGDFITSDEGLRLEKPDVSPRVVIHVFDPAAPESGRQLHPSTPETTAERATQGLHAEEKFEVGGRTWLLVATPGPGFRDLPSSASAWVVLLFGLLTTGVYVLYLRQKIRQSAQIAQAARKIEIVKQRLTEAHRIAQLGSIEHILGTRLWRVGEDARAMLDLAATEAAGELPVILRNVHCDDRPHLITVLLACELGAVETGVDLEFRAGPPHQQRVIHVLGKRVAPVETGGLQMLVTLQDITGRRKAQEALRESEERFQQISNNIDQVFYLAGIVSNRIAYVSPAFEKMFGRGWQMSSQAPGLWLEAVIPECREQIVASQKRLLAGEAVQDEYQIVGPYGSTRWIKHHANPIRDPQGKVSKYAGVLEDITEAHAAREALQQSEEKYRSLVRNIPDVVWSVDSDRRVVFNTANAERLTGYGSEDYYKHGPGLWFESIHPDDAARVKQAFEALFDRGQPYDVECRARRKDGTWIWVHDRAIVTYEKDGKRYADGMVSDITERKRAEEELRSKTAFLEALSNSTIDGILVVDDQNQKILQNHQFMKTLKVPQHILDQKDDLVMRHDFAARIKNSEEFLAKIAYLYEHPSETSRDEIEFKDGMILDRYSAPVIGKDGKYYGRIWTFRDITERRRDEAVLRQLSLAVEQSPVSIMITDPDGRITYVNPRFTEWTGYSLGEVSGRNPRLLKSGYTSPDEYKKLWQEITQGGVWRGEFRNRRKNGEFYWESVVITPIKDAQGAISRFLAVKEDITERKLMESQLRQAQKLEAIGQLAAGIAHEINTPTQFASDNLTFLRDSWESLSAVLEAYRSAIADAMGSGLTEQTWSVIREAERKEDLEFIASEIPRAIEQALDGVQRVARIVRAMKEFSHPDSGEKAPVDINKAIETTITVARNEWKYVAEIETRFCPGLPLVPCHAGELNQVILNLIVNAAHAIKDKVKDGPKGAITVRTGVQGEFAEIAVTDTGSGIPEAIRSKVFDPFFTTKEVGKGTGQDLALAHSIIVKKYTGKIWFETEIGQGTTFFIHLPLHAPGGEQEP